jgi:hypothetical protein
VRRQFGPLLTFTPALARYLLSKGADPNRQTNESGAPVFVGVAYMRRPSVGKLTDYDFDPLSWCTALSGE